MSKADRKAFDRAQDEANLYIIKVQGVEMAAFCRDHLWDACADAMHENRKAHGVSISNHARGRVIDFTDACAGDSAIIRRYKKQAADFALQFGH